MRVLGWYGGQITLCQMSDAVTIAVLMRVSIL
jgi:hypothetical protein